MPENKYFPELSSVVKVENFPEQLSFIQDGLNQLFENFYYREFQYTKGENGHGSFDNVLLCPRKLGIDIPGTGLSLIINPSHSDISEFSELPITIEYTLYILSFIRNFKVSNFSFKPAIFFNFIKEHLDINETNIILYAVNTFELEAIPFNDFVDKINSTYNLTGIDVIPYPPGNSPEEDAEFVNVSVKNNQSLIEQFIGVYNIIFTIYLENFEIEEIFERINVLVYEGIGESVIDYIKNLFKPEIKALLPLECAIEFPRKWLVPLDANGEPIQDEDIKTQLLFNIGNFEFSTSKGIGFENELTTSLTYPSQIGNTGFTIGFTEAKLDLSRKTNIPEATLDGRPDDFIGVFIEHATIGLPKLFSENGASTTSIVGRNLIIGTGGISGTLGLDDPEGLINVNFGGFEISFNAFSITFMQNSIIGSDIHGTLKIEGFENSAGGEAVINIDVHFEEDGDFSITASEDIGIEALSIPEVLKINLTSVSIGKKEDLFFLKVSGGLEIIHPKLKEYLKGVIDIKGLTIWSDGSFEIEGGGLQLPKAVSIEVGPAKISITAIHLGSHEQIHGGVMRQYKYFGFDGGVSVNPGGVDARGDGLKFYFTTDHETIADLHVFLRIESIYIDIIIPGDASPEKAAVLLQGYLSMKGPDPDDPEAQPGTEYIGGVAFSLPQINLAGSAAMKYDPKEPSFLIDIGLELPVPIPLGPTGLGIYGFRGLLGLRYVASKEHIGVNTWYEYYKAVA